MDLSLREILLNIFISFHEIENAKRTLKLRVRTAHVRLCEFLPLKSYSTSQHLAAERSDKNPRGTWQATTRHRLADTMLEKKGFPNTGRVSRQQLIILLWRRNFWSTRSGVFRASADPRERETQQICGPNAGSTLVQRLRRWASIDSALGEDVGRR